MWCGVLYAQEQTTQQNIFANNPLVLDMPKSWLISTDRKLSEARDKLINNNHLDGTNLNLYMFLKSFAIVGSQILRKNAELEIKNVFEQIGKFRSQKDLLVKGKRDIVQKDLVATEGRLNTMLTQENSMLFSSVLSWIYGIHSQPKLEGILLSPQSAQKDVPTEQKDIQELQKNIEVLRDDIKENKKSLIKIRKDNRSELYLMLYTGIMSKSVIPLRLRSVNYFKNPQELFFTEPNLFDGEVNLNVIKKVLLSESEDKEYQLNDGKEKVKDFENFTPSVPLKMNVFKDVNNFDNSLLQSNNAQFVAEYADKMLGMSKSEIALTDVTFYSQMDATYFEGNRCWSNGNHGNQCCNKACLKILESKQLTTSRDQQIIIAKKTSDDCDDLVANENFSMGVKVIDESLFKHKAPIMIGVHLLVKSLIMLNNNFWGLTII